MVLKKPYALLIKYFRHIHVFLAAVTAVILFSFYNIYSVFRTYTTSGWLSAKNMILEHNYISNFLVILIVINIVMLVVLYILMRYKDKPRLFYISSIIINILITVLLIFNNSIFEQITKDVITTTTLRLYRDINLISLFIIGISLLILVIRSVGFDIKKFDFGKDLQEFKVTSEDSEEFELQLGVDDEEYKRKFRKRIRELKIYYKENKVVVNIILSIATFMILLSISSIYIFDNTYKEGKKVKIDKNIYLRVNDTYVTKTDFYGTQVTEDMVLIVRFDLINNSKEDYKLDTNKLNIVQNGTVKHPITNEYMRFFAYGTGYINQVIDKNTTDSYILIYEIEEQEKYKHLYLTLKNKRVKITPSNVMGHSVTKLGEEVSIHPYDDLTIKFKVGSIMISDNFNSVSYVDGEIVEFNEMEGEKTQDQTIIKLLDSEMVSIVDGKQAPWGSIDGFVECVTDGKIVTYDIENYYTYYNNSMIFLVVPKEVERSERIVLWLNFLDTTVKYVIKNN